MSRNPSSNAAKGLGSVILRLTSKERETLKILTAALKVSEYTDEVDAVRSSYQRHEKIQQAMVDLYAIVLGLSLVASELPTDVRDRLGDEKLRIGTFAPVFNHAFEVGRRFKRFNPDKMRSEYGKLLMMLQDAVASTTRYVDMPHLVAPVKTVASALVAINATALLDEPDLDVATSLLEPRCRAEDVSRKEAAFKALVHKYGGPAPASNGNSLASSPAPEGATMGGSDGGALLTGAAGVSGGGKREVVELCLKSIDDAKVFTTISIAPIEQLISYLDTWFRDETSTFSLKIRSGKGGSCLTHSHSEHRQYVKEALTLWKIVQRDIFDFWECVELDMIGPNASGYRIMDTGQGFHRVSQAPLTYARMHEAISEARSIMGGWVGSTIVHLGDRDVPNALVFIDKYTIIPRLTGPIASTIQNILLAFDESVPEKYPGYRKLLLGEYENVDELCRTILCDFFRHGFDGSGDDGGSCIDGRLTSAWNWCNLLHKKPFYPAFILTGFTSFDAAY